MTTTLALTRFRGCCIGGPCHGKNLPPGGVHAQRVVLHRTVSAEAGVQEFGYLHRRMDDLANGESVEFLVYETLSDEDAARLVDEERERRGGWGEPLLTLPAAGFRYETEGVLGDLGVEAPGTLQALGIVKRFSPQGVVIVQGFQDRSRPIGQDELAPERCEWCGHGVAHSIDLHRERLEIDAADRRAVAFQGEPPEFHPLASAIDEILALGDDFQAACVQRAIQDKAVADAHAEFLARRRAELPDNIQAYKDNGSSLVLPPGVRL